MAALLYASFSLTTWNSYVNGDVRGTVQNGRSLNSDHRRHDRLLIARFAAGDAYPTEIDEARELVDSCSDCAALAEDIRSLSLSLARLPDAKRTRDFRLTPEQAERLHGNWLERLMRTLAAPGFAMLRPVAGVAMSIGLALVIVGSLPVGLSSAGAPEDMRMFDAGSQAPAMASDAPAPQMTPLPEGTAIAAPTSDVDNPADPTKETPTKPEGAPGDSSEPTGRSGDLPPDVAVLQASQEPPTDNLNNAYLPDGDGAGQAADDSTGRNGEMAVAAPRTGDMLITIGILIAVAGLSLLAVIWFARRRYRDPLLR